MDKGLYSIPTEVLYGTRLLVFLEESPQSDTYRQVVMTEKEFEKFTEHIGTKKKGGKVSFHLSEKVYKLPDVQEIYP